MKKAKVIHIRVPQYEYDMLQILSKKRHSTHSSIIRTALLLYFDSLKLTPPPDLDKSPSGEDLLRSIHAR
jgi:hypothetical protein